MSVKTERIFPPIPTRSFDWMAYDDDVCHCPECRQVRGYGATEAEAIADFVEQMQEKTA